MFLISCSDGDLGHTLKAKSCIKSRCPSEKGTIEQNSEKS